MTGASTVAASGTQLARLRSLVDRGACAEGVTPSRIPGVILYRSTRPRPRESLLFEPSVCVVASGAKRAYLGSQTYLYDPATYLVLTTSLPLECQVVRATDSDPFLSVLIDIRISDLFEIVLRMPPGARPPPGREGPSVFTAPADEALLSSVVHLLTVEQDAQDARVLGVAAVREVLYRVLRDERGTLLWAAVGEADPSHGTTLVLRYIREHYREKLTIRDLARVGHMAPSTLHEKFKRLTAMSPMRYVTHLRLHEARRLMLQDGLDARTAGREVGYRSAAHFSREFKRVFGAPPVRHVRTLGTADWMEG